MLERARGYGVGKGCAKRAQVNRLKFLGIDGSFWTSNVNLFLFK